MCAMLCWVVCLVSDRGQRATVATMVLLVTVSATVLAKDDIYDMSAFVETDEGLRAKEVPMAVGLECL